MDSRLNSPEEARDQRAEYINRFNDMMVKIWKEQIVKLDVIDTSKLYNSILLRRSKTDSRVTEIYISYEAQDYGVYQDRGTGRETPKGNRGDIGRAKVRERRPWLSKKFYSSYCRLRGFMAENLGEEFCAAIPLILGKKA